MRSIDKRLNNLRASTHRGLKWVLSFMSTMATTFFVVTLEMQ